MIRPSFKCSRAHSSHVRRRNSYCLTWTVSHTTCCDFVTPRENSTQLSGDHHSERAACTHKHSLLDISRANKNNVCELSRLLPGLQTPSVVAQSTYLPQALHSWSLFDSSPTPPYWLPQGTRPVGTSLVHLSLPTSARLSVQPP